jgi:hypothetical protein
MQSNCRRWLLTIAMVWNADVAQAVPYSAMELESAFTGRLAITPLFSQVRTQGMTSTVYAFQSISCPLSCLRDNFKSGKSIMIQEEKQLSFVYKQSVGSLVVERRRGGVLTGNIIVSANAAPIARTSLPFGVVNGIKIMDVETQDARVINRTLLLVGDNGQMWRDLARQSLRHGFSVVFEETSARLVELSKPREALIIHATPEQGGWSVLVNYQKSMD